jgi:hypothetical protein
MDFFWVIKNEKDKQTQFVGMRLIAIANSFGVNLVQKIDYQQKNRFKIDFSTEGLSVTEVRIFSSISSLLYNICNDLFCFLILRRKITSPKTLITRYLTP